MLYYKKTELSKKLDVSITTINRWISNAEKGKNNLQLTTVNDKIYIVNSSHNDSLFFKLKGKGSVYKNKSTHIYATPEEKFYSTFTTSQVVEIINALKTKKEIPLKLTYINGGAKIWNNIIESSYNKGDYETSLTDVELLKEASYFLLRKSNSYDKVNIVDIGQGNSITTKKFIQSFLDTGKLNKYIAIDVSKEMNEIAEANINKWFPGLNFTSYVHDIEKYDIANILFNEKKGGNVLNIVLLVGATIGNVKNQRWLYDNIRYGFDDRDIFIVTNKLEKADNKTDFIEPLTKHPERHLWIPDLLGIDLESPELVFYYDEEEKAKVGYLKLSKPHTITFKVEGFEIVVEIPSNTKIQIFYHKMSARENLIKILEKADFEPIHMITSSDHSHILVTCKSLQNNF